VTRVKICGITNLEDAQAAVDYGADALGFILVPESPRFMGDNLSFFEEDYFELPPLITRVAVVTDSSKVPSDSFARFDAIQFYEHSSAIKRNDSKHYIRALRIRDSKSLGDVETAMRFRGADAILLDTYHKDKLGGSGEIFNWDLAVEAKKRFRLPIILAGGLTPDNVGDAIAKVRPYAVDVSSGVEAEPGRKDHAKLKAFLKAVRKADHLLSDSLD
jgi:phosphoribosylanthranilate isomerase